MSATSKLLRLKAATGWAAVLRPKATAPALPSVSPSCCSSLVGLHHMSSNKNRQILNTKFNEIDSKLDIMNLNTKFDEINFKLDIMKQKQESSHEYGFSLLNGEIEKIGIYLRWMHDEIAKLNAKMASLTKLVQKMDASVRGEKGATKLPVIKYMLHRLRGVLGGCHLKKAAVVMVILSALFSCFSFSRVEPKAVEVMILSFLYLSLMFLFLP